MKEERYSVNFSVSLMWQEKSGTVRRISGRCVDLSPQGIRVETRDRIEVGTMVLVSCSQFGRMGQAMVRHIQREKMLCLVGLKFGATFGLGDPARRTILERVLSPDDPHATAPGAPSRGARKTPGADD